MNKKILSEFLNTTPEIHAFVLGIYRGLSEWKGKEMPDNPDIQEEPHYFAGGYTVGTLMRWGFIIAIGGKML